MRTYGIHKTHARIGIRIQLEVGPSQLVIHFLRHGVIFFRPIDFDQQNVFFGFNIDGHIEYLKMVVSEKMGGSNVLS